MRLYFILLKNIDCHEFADANSRNDESTLPPRLCEWVKRTKQSKKNKITSLGGLESIELGEILLFAKAKSSKNFNIVALRADFIYLDCHAEPLARLAMTAWIRLFRLCE